MGLIAIWLRYEMEILTKSPHAELRFGGKMGSQGMICPSLYPTTHSTPAAYISSSGKAASDPGGRWLIEK